MVQQQSLFKLLGTILTAIIIFCYEQYYSPTGDHYLFLISITLRTFSLRGAA